jgi:hypothetical protein
LTLSRFEQHAPAAGANAGVALDCSSNKDRGTQPSTCAQAHKHRHSGCPFRHYVSEPYLLTFPECVRILLFCDTLSPLPGIPA